MANWTEPKNNYTAGSQVTPAIFNELAENERYLKQTQDTKITTADVQNASIGSKVFATRTNIVDSEQLKIGFGKIRKWFSDLRGLAFKDVITEADILGTISGTKISGAVALADEATQLANGRSIGISGVTATAQSFDGSANITIQISAIPSSLLIGTIASARLPIATTSAIGAIKGGGGVTINSDGTLNIVQSGTGITVTARPGLGNNTNLDAVLNYISNVFLGSQTVSKIKANTLETN